MQSPLKKLFIVPIKNTIQLTNDWPIDRLIYQWQASIHFNWPLIGQNDVILYRHYEKLPSIKYYSYLKQTFYVAKVLTDVEKNIYGQTFNLLLVAQLIFN